MNKKINESDNGLKVGSIIEPLNNKNKSGRGITLYGVKVDSLAFILDKNDKNFNKRIINVEGKQFYL